jgi:hypothetical protein
MDIVSLVHPNFYMVNNSKTLEQLEMDYWGNAPENSSSLIKTCYKFRQKKINEFELDDLRIMINQNIGIKYLIPIAIAELEKSALVEANYYEGDLLMSVLSCEDAIWNSVPDLKSSMVNLLNSNLNKFEDLDSDEIKDELMDLINNFLKKYS